MKKLVAAAVLTLAVSLPLSGLVFADGTETLGPPGVPVATGTGIVSGGTGMVAQPASFDVTVPAGSTVQQVLLYWEGQHRMNVAGDDTVNVNGTDVTGVLIGGPTFFFTGGGTEIHSSAYRADVTALGLLSPGVNSITLSGMDFDWFDNGAGVVAIVDDGGPSAEIGLRDGLDLAYAGFKGARGSTVSQTFTFAAEATDRTASLTMMLGSVESAARPNALSITVEGILTKLINPFGSFAGSEWDVLTVDIDLPAGSTSVTVQVISESDGSTNRPASLSWIVGGLSVPVTPVNPPGPPPPTVGTGTIGYWKNHPGAWPVETVSLGGVSFTKEQAIAILGQPVKGDATLILAKQLIGAKLNVAIGTDPSCIATTIGDADSFLGTYPVGSGLKANSAAWTTGEPLASTLDAYNNGQLCAPHRD